MAVKSPVQRLVQVSCSRGVAIRMLIVLRKGRVRQLADFCKRSPDQITEDQIRKFSLHLKNDK